MTQAGEAHNHPTDRPQTVHNGQRPPEDSHRPSTTLRRVTVPEAADILGTTTDAVRSRMRRGKLRREEGGDGTVYVLLDDVRDSPTSAKDGRETGNQTVGDGRETVGDGPLVERMASEIDHLRGRLEEAHAANRENRRIIAALTQLIPELEASPDPREGHVAAPEETAKDTSPRSSRSPHSAALGGGRSSGWSKAMPLAIYVLLGLCIALSVYPVLDELLEQREESRLRPRLQKHRHPATPADACGAAASVKAKGMTPEKQQEPPQSRKLSALDNYLGSIYR